MLTNLKKVLVIMLVITLLGCSSTNTSSNKESEEEKKFLAEDKGKVALFIVGDDSDGFELEEEGINNIQSIFNAASFEVAQKKYPFLKLKQEPTYIVFDNKEQIFKTNDYDELVNFLKTTVKN